jgi:hypothetical protein
MVCSALLQLFQALSVLCRSWQYEGAQNISQAVQTVRFPGIDLARIQMAFLSDQENKVAGAACALRIGGIIEF